MLLVLGKNYNSFRPDRMMVSSVGADGFTREIYFGAADDTPDSQVVMIVSDSMELLEAERAALVSVCSTYDGVVISDIFRADDAACLAITLPKGYIMLPDMLRKHRQLRWDIALPLTYEILRQTFNQIAAGNKPASLTPASVAVRPVEDDPDVIDVIIPMLPREGFMAPCDIAFIAPEVESGQWSERSVVYSAALLLIVMLQGGFPWKIDGETDPAEIARKIQQSKPELKIPLSLRRLLLPCLAVDPADRPESVAAFAELLYEFMDGASIYHSADRFSQPAEAPAGKEPDQNPAPDENPGPAPSPKPGRSPKPDRRFDDFDGPRRDEPKANFVISRVEGGGFSDVAGLDDVKTKMSRNFISIVRNPELAKTFRIEPPNGVLLWGPPGNGKSFISRKLAEESGLLYTLVNPGDIGSIYVHGTQEMIADLFKRCEDMARKEKTGVLMVLEEFDALVPVRNSHSTSTNRSDEVAEFLTRLNNCASKGVYVVATTNRIDAIDPAVMRKGRMDEIIYIGLPDEKVRHKLFELELRDRPHGDIDLAKLVTLTDGFTSGDISFLVKESARKSFEQSLSSPDKSVVPISQEILESTIRESNPSVTSGERHNYEKLRDSYERNRRQAPKVGF